MPPYIPAANIRSAVVANISWVQAQWYIDPQNVTGNASDGNAGSDPNFPVKTWNGGVIGRYGTQSPVLNSSAVPDSHGNKKIFWTFLSPSPADGSDPIVFSPTYVNGTQGEFLGLLTAAQKVGSGVIAGLVAKNPATGVGLSANITVAGAAVNMMLQNTTAGKLSRTFLAIANGGANFSLTQPMTPSDGWPQVPDPTPVDTYANGDTYDLYQLTTVDFVDYQPIVADLDSNNSNFAIIHLLGIINTTNPPPASTNSFYVGDGMGLNDGWCQKRVVLVRPANGKNTLFFNFAMPGGCTGGIDTVYGAGSKPFIYGGYGPIGLLGALLDYDTMVTGNSRLIGGIMGAVNVVGSLELGSNCGIGVQNFASRLWGAGSVDVTGRLQLQGVTAVATLLQTGGTTINGLSANAFNATRAAPSVINGNVAVTPANIDASATGLWMPGGGCVASF